MSDYKSVLQQVSKNNNRIFANSPEVTKTFVTLNNQAYEAKALDHKQKELIALGIAISVRCEGCITSHVNGAIEAGATMQELAETVEVAITMGGGPSMVYGGKALECAEEFFKDKE